MQPNKLAGDSVLGPLRRPRYGLSAPGLFPEARAIVAVIDDRLVFWAGGSRIFPWLWPVGVVRTAPGEDGADERT